MENNLDVFKNLSSEYKDEQLQLLKRKGIFPYDYLDYFDRFNETSLPDKKCSVIGCERISRY